MKDNSVKKCDMVNPETSDFGSICVCAVRYSLGRMTYMPSIVQGFILKYLPHIQDTALYVIARDVKEHGGVNNRKEAYGMDVDYVEWMEFLDKIKQELYRRGKCEWIDG